MGSRFSFLVAAMAVAIWSLPVTAAQYEKTGSWVFNSTAFAEDGEAMLYACAASTVSAEGTELSLSLEPAADDGVDARMSLTNDAWALDAAPVRVRFDIGTDHWVLPGQSGGKSVAVIWTGDAALLTFLEDLSSSSFAGLTGRNGATVAQFSLNGSRGAIEAMTACVEAQIGQGLGEVLRAGSGGAENPF